MQAVHRRVAIWNKKEGHWEMTPLASFSFKGYPSMVYVLVAVLVAVQCRISGNILRHSAI